MPKNEHTMILAEGPWPFPRTLQTSMNRTNEQVDSPEQHADQSHNRYSLAEISMRTSNPDMIHVGTLANNERGTMSVVSVGAENQQPEYNSSMVRGVSMISQ